MLCAEPGESISKMSRNLRRIGVSATTHFREVRPGKRGYSRRSHRQAGNMQLGTQSDSALPGDGRPRGRMRMGAKLPLSSAKLFDSADGGKINLCRKPNEDDNGMITMEGHRIQQWG